MLAKIEEGVEVNREGGGAVQEVVIDGKEVEVAVVVAKREEREVEVEVVVAVAAAAADVAGAAVEAVADGVAAEAAARAAGAATEVAADGKPGLQVIKQKAISPSDVVAAPPHLRVDESDGRMKAQHLHLV